MKSERCQQQKIIKDKSVPNDWQKKRQIKPNEKKKVNPDA